MSQLAFKTIKQAQEFITNNQKKNQEMAPRGVQNLHFPLTRPAPVF